MLGRGVLAVKQAWCVCKPQVCSLSRSTSIFASTPQIHIRTVGPGPRQHVSVFWDIENIPPSKESVPRSESGLKDLSCRLFPEVRGHVAVHVSAQPAGLHRRSQCLSEAVNQHMAPSSKRNAADLVLQQAIYDFAKQHGPAACAMLVSGDTGFADILEYCKACGCMTVVIGRGHSKELKQELRWHRSALAQHADMAVTWTHAHPCVLARLVATGFC